MAELHLASSWKRGGCLSSHDAATLHGWMRSNDAGEVCAVWIYRGAAAAHRLRLYAGFAAADDPAARFIARHLQAEKRHLSWMETLVTPSERSALRGLCAGLGLLLGFVPFLLFGQEALFHAVVAVESYVDWHYGVQLDLLDSAPKLSAAECALRALLASAHADEIDHKNQGIALSSTPGALLKGPLWMFRRTIYAGCASVAALMRVM